MKNAPRGSRYRDLLHPQDRTSLAAELDKLIGRFGTEAPAEQFIRFE
ncbi:MAG TPA: hypothetical protein VFB20_13225 [Burkholderiales bacterium]|nr:hypothetical protein [Burkholderiales bacterium]